MRVAIPDLVSPSYFPAIAAVELGCFRAEGLEASLELIYPVTRTYTMLREGAVDLVGGAAHAALYAFPGWQGCRLAAALGQRMYWFLVVRSDLGAARGDLHAVKGLRIGAAPGPVDGLRAMLRSAGIDPDREVTIAAIPAAGAGVSFGVAAARALAAREVDGFWANGMAAELAVRGGYGTLIVDARRGDGPPGSTDYTFPALVVAQATLDQHPERVAASVRALQAAHRLLGEDPQRADEAARRWFPAQELSLIAELIRRDLPFYDTTISERSVESMNAFARHIGLPTGNAGYADIVAQRSA